MSQAKTFILPQPDMRGRYRFGDGCIVAHPHTITLNFRTMRGTVDPQSVFNSEKWIACWADGTPLRGDNDEISYFDTAQEAATALSLGGEGPAK